MMVDDGSAINIVPLNMLPKYGLTESDLDVTSVVIRAYDESKREATGSFTCVVKTGPIEAVVEFLVLDIPARFTALLGRPCFHGLVHGLGRVSSTLHQMVRFLHNGKIVTIPANESSVHMTEYGMQGGDIKHFSGFEVCMIKGMDSNGTTGPLPGMPALGSPAARMMNKWGYQPGLGLGKNENGIESPIQVEMKKGRAGLGCQEILPYSPLKEKRLMADFISAAYLADNGPKEKLFSDDIADLCAR